MATFRTMSGQGFTLSSSISSTQTTITLSSFKVPVSLTDITMASMGTTTAYGTLAPGTSSAELISFTGITQNADGTALLTGVTRGLDKEYPYAEDSSFKQPHAGQTLFILSDAPQVFNQYGALVNDNTWSGRQQFPAGGTASAAVVGVTYSAPTQDIEIATKKYVDDIAISGSPDATTSVKGIVQLPTQTQAEAGTALGSTGATLVLQNAQYGARYLAGYGTATGTAVGFTAHYTPTPTAYATGMLIGFTSSFTNTGNTTINVNGLGAKNLQLGSTGLFAGAIATNSIVGATYNGTSFDVIYRNDGITTAATANKIPLRSTTGDITVPSTPTASTDAASKGYVDIKTIKKTGSTTKDMSATTTTTIAHGLGTTPTMVRFYVNKVQADSATTALSVVSSIGSYDGTTQNCIYVATSTNGSTSMSAIDTTHAIHFGFGATAGADSDNNVGTVTVDATNITITWVETNTCTGTGNIVWEAEA